MRKLWLKGQLESGKFMFSGHLAVCPVQIQTLETVHFICFTFTRRNFI